MSEFEELCTILCDTLHATKILYELAEQGLSVKQEQEAAVLRIRVPWATEILHFGYPAAAHLFKKLRRDLVAQYDHLPPPIHMDADSGVHHFSGACYHSLAMSIIQVAWEALLMVVDAYEGLNPIRVREAYEQAREGHRSLPF